MEIRVHVTPGARKEKVVRRPDGSFDISVREEAQHNAANRRIKTLLSLHFGISEKQVRVVRGGRSRTKSYSIGLS